ncbi:MAG: HIT family hydrolase [Deltaproteobacteria bacterium CG11_big_fil_rev_8_21_14_0_20_45_16]|nr:MAG: HIT family hydrolase [Deltaproteobacteria bacterium CG11_big_fil_rev_8_21_14_0_20_45_16]
MTKKKKGKSQPSKKVGRNKPNTERKVLWAPWRMAVIEQYRNSSSCILCGIRDDRDNSRTLIIHRTKLSYVVMNRFPYSSGHLMVVPNRHIGDWEDLSKDESLEIMSLSQSCIKVLRECMGAQGFNVGANLGAVAGAGIADHVHMHIVPRWQGDINFMPLFSEVKIISEHLDDTYLKICQAWRKCA